MGRGEEKEEREEEREKAREPKAYCNTDIKGVSRVCFCVDSYPSKWEHQLFLWSVLQQKKLWLV